jgi:hypothetical protein
VRGLKGIRVACTTILMQASHQNGRRGWRVPVWQSPQAIVIANVANIITTAMTTRTVSRGIGFLHA